ncbi:cupin domain-containing protein [Nocardia sp. NPDC004568]|uniref:cupin domain-containing protein n=1 Tax=Nocardia sp. NPDC004568 TaxID=3154551 RepID=UPI0033A84183
MPGPTAPPLIWIRDHCPAQLRLVRAFFPLCTGSNSERRRRDAVPHPRRPGRTGRDRGSRGPTPRRGLPSARGCRGHRRRTGREPARSRRRRGRAAPHYHVPSTELFYMLTGIAEFFLDGAPATVPAGSLVVIPPGMPHAFGAAPGSPVDLLIVLTPGVQRFDYFRHLGRIQRGHADFDILLPEQQRYDVHFLPATTWRRRVARTPKAPA